MTDDAQPEERPGLLHKVALGTVFLLAAAHESSKSLPGIARKLWRFFMRIRPSNDAGRTFSAVMTLAIDELTDGAVILPESSDEDQGVAKPPGHRVMWVAEFLCREETYKNVYQAAIWDIRAEIFQAWSNGRAWKARVARARGYLTLALITLNHLGGLLASPFRKAREVLFS